MNSNATPISEGKSKAQQVEEYFEGKDTYEYSKEILKTLIVRAFEIYIEEKPRDWAKGKIFETDILNLVECIKKMELPKIERTY